MITLNFSKSILKKLKGSLAITLRLSDIRLYRLASALLWDVGGGDREIIHPRSYI